MTKIVDNCLARRVEATQSKDKNCDKTFHSRKLRFFTKKQSHHI